MKSGNLNFLEHSGPLQACNGIALPLHLPEMCLNTRKDRELITEKAKISLSASGFVLHITLELLSFSEHRVV
jgi:actin-related protein